MNNITQRIIDLTRYLERHGNNLPLDQAFNLENHLRDLKKQRDSEARRAYEAFLLGDK